MSLKEIENSKTIVLAFKLDLFIWSKYLPNWKKGIIM